MKKIIYISLVLAVAAAVLLGISFIKNSEQEVSAKTEAVQVKDSGKEDHSCCAAEKEAGEYTENSLYQLESEWTNQAAEKVSLSDFLGKKVVMTMFFASCTYACPILVEDMRRIDTKIPAGERYNYRFVIVSIDHERDTPAKLKEFGDMKGLDYSRWTLLTGSQESILELAALTGFKYKKESDGQYSHSNTINILNEEGEVEFQHQGLNQDVTMAANYLRN
jgi:protein SCO1